MVKIKIENVHDHPKISDMFEFFTNKPSITLNNLLKLIDSQSADKILSAYWLTHTDARLSEEGRNVTRWK